MRKTYKTAMGKSIDMGAMTLANERVRAVGNMKVNARGDLIDSNNNVIKSRQQQVAEQYGTQGKKQNRPTNVQKPQAEAAPAPVAAKTEPPVPVVEDIDFPQDVAEDDVEVVKQDAPAKEPAKPQGLAAAIARTKENKST